MDKFKIPIELTSGFSIEVTPLPPYYLDFLDDILPIPEFPQRKIILASGDTFECEYVKPENPPNSSDNTESELYMRYVETEHKIEKILVERTRAKRDFLFSNCITVVSGPYEVDSEEWVNRLEAIHPTYKVSSHKGRRLLAFIKSNVVTSKEEAEYILQTCAFTEVGMQGIINALRGFQVQVAGTEFDTSVVGAQGQK